MQPRGWWPARLLCLGDSPGQGTGVGCHFLLQEIFVTWGSNLGLLNYQADSLPTEPPGSSFISLKDHIFLFWNNYYCLSFTYSCLYYLMNICSPNFKDLPGGADGKVSACNAGDRGSIPGLGRSPGEGNGNLLQYPGLENLPDRGAWQATIHGVVTVRHNLVMIPAPPRIY